MITIPGRDWRLMAVCRHAKPELFFPVYHSCDLGVFVDRAAKAVSAQNVHSLQR
jgi:hypothetical protein